MENANENDELLKFLRLEEDISIENGTASNEGEYDLFDPNKVQTVLDTESNGFNGKVEQGMDIGNEDEEEDINTEVREQITVNGVVYTIPPDRRITIGGRTIDVDELLANEAETISLEDVDDNLKKGFITNNNGKQDNIENEQDNDDDDDEDNEEEEE